jgi:hypothetical protein
LASRTAPSPSIHEGAPVRQPGRREFASTKPPFLFDADIHVTPESHVWILRSRAAGDSIPRYDVFDRSGRKIHEVRLRSSNRVIGFGKGTIYVVYTDGDDLQHLKLFSPVTVHRQADGNPRDGIELQLHTEDVSWGRFALAKPNDYLDGSGSCRMRLRRLSLLAGLAAIPARAQTAPPPQTPRAVVDSFFAALAPERWSVAASYLDVQSAAV